MAKDGFFIFCLPKLNEVILFDLFTRVDKQSQGSKINPTVLGKSEPLVDFFDPLFKPVIGHWAARSVHPSIFTQRSSNDPVSFQYGPKEEGPCSIGPGMQIIHQFIHGELINDALISGYFS